MVEDYHGEAYVAFLDVSGFKRRVKKNLALAVDMLDEFYGTIYDVCLRINDLKRSLELPEANIVAASDCAIVFSRPPNSNSFNPDQDKIDCLNTILSFVQQVNRRLIVSQHSSPILTTCSIAYGLFIYEDKREFCSLRKNCFLGRPYMEAFIDNEKLKRRPGYCRLLRENLKLSQNHPEKDLLSLLKKRGNYYYFFWMLGSLDGLEDFETEYKRACRLRNHSKYQGLIRVLQKYVGDNAPRDF